MIARAALFVSSLGLTSCNAIVGIREPIDQPTAATPFVGTWASSGTQVFKQCTVKTDEGSAPASTLVISGEGSTVTFAFEGCAVKAIVDGDVATVTADQSCAVAGTGYTIFYDPTSAFVFTNEARTQARLDAVGIAEGPGNAACRFESKNDYTKNGP
ncbi:MAG: hypothetical protein KF819_17905 [Labilithrix sp.]|nr:hypothetical protein [Labilithrix sp.]